MARVFLQPAANDLAQNHLKRSIERPISRDLVDSLSSSERKKIVGSLGNGEFYLWKCRDGRNRKQWKKMLPGDTVLFYTGKGQFGYQSHVIATV